MRRLLKNPPKKFAYEVIGNLVRATVNKSTDFEPVTFVPRRPYYCPVCGEESDGEGRVSTVLAIDFDDGQKCEMVAWTHLACFESFTETDEPDAELE